MPHFVIKQQSECVSELGHIFGSPASWQLRFHRKKKKKKKKTLVKRPEVILLLFSSGHYSHRGLSLCANKLALKWSQRGPDRMHCNIEIFICTPGQTLQAGEELLILMPCHMAKSPLYLCLTPSPSSIWPRLVDKPEQHQLRGRLIYTWGRRCLEIFGLSISHRAGARVRNWTQTHLTSLFVVSGVSHAVSTFFFWFTWISLCLWSVAF